MTQHYRLPWLLLLSTLLLSCRQIDQPTPTSLPPTDVATALPATADPPLATALPLPTLAATTSSPVDIYAQVAPSIAMVSTEDSTGSAILIEDGYLLTNAHVLWPYRAARIIFSDGSEYDEVPLLAWDLLNDLAVLGPIETELPSLALADGEHLPIGSPVYLIGFPGEIDLYPQASITQGLISRYRQWALEGVTYFQTDAAIAGGQSGGALLSDSAELIGVSGFSFTSADFAVVTSVADIVQQVRKLSQGEVASGIGLRNFPTGDGVRETDVSLVNEWDAANFMVYGEIDELWTLSVEGNGDVAFNVFTANGEELVYIDEVESGVESAEITFDTTGPVFLQLYQYSFGRNSYQLASNLNLIPLPDPDDLQAVTVGETYYGNLDFPGDYDSLTLDLEAGQTISVLVDSVMIDPYLTIYSMYGDADVAIDDDSGGGLFGVSAELTYTATESGQYFIIIDNSFENEYGGYIVTINESSP